MLLLLLGLKTADQPGIDHTAGGSGKIHQNQNIQRIAIAALGRRYEPEIERKRHAFWQRLGKFKACELGVEVVFIGTAFGRFDYRPKASFGVKRGKLGQYWPLTHRNDSCCAFTEREVSLERCTSGYIPGGAVPKSFPLLANRQPARTGETPFFRRAKKKFHRLFPAGFRDETYLAWERDYKWEAHQEWEKYLNAELFRKALSEHRYTDIAARAVRIESGRSLLFSFEKMALRDAVRETQGAKLFAEGLFALLHGNEPLEERFERWCRTVEALPRKQTRVLTWPLVTVFGFIAQPRTHIFLKPNTTKEAARVLGLPFNYISRPNGQTYAEYLVLAGKVRANIRDMRPRDMIDVQSFLWVQGSDEYR